MLLNFKSQTISLRYVLWRTYVHCIRNKIIVLIRRKIQETTFNTTNKEILRTLTDRRFLQYYRNGDQ